MTTGVPLCVIEPLKCCRVYLIYFKNEIIKNVFEGGQVLRDCCETFSDSIRSA